MASTVALAQPRTDDLGPYTGSRFADVVDALNANPYQRVWGTEGKGFRRLVHPNGVCLTGRWTIQEETPYTGYFATSSSALIVSRYSTCCTETKRGQTR